MLLHYLQHSKKNRESDFQLKQQNIRLSISELFFHDIKKIKFKRKMKSESLSPFSNSNLI